LYDKKYECEATVLLDSTTSASVGQPLCRWRY